MIKATFNHSELGIQSFVVEGHAESAEFGRDLVCAAVTSVTAGTVNAIEMLANIDPDVEVRESGYLRFAIPTKANDEQMKTIQTLLKAMVISLETIEHDNRKYIQIIHE